MNIFEMIDEFLKSQGLVWFNREVVTNEIRDKMVYTREIMECDIKDFKMFTIPVEIASLVGKHKIIFNLDISVDWLRFEVYGLNMRFPKCFALKEEYEKLFEERTLDKEWQKFCLTKKGLVYETTVRKYVAEQKREISEETHSKIIKHIHDIHALQMEKEADYKALDNGVRSLAEIKKEITETNNV